VAKLGRVYVASMSEAIWDVVDHALEDWLVPERDAMRAVVAEADAAGLPGIHVSAMLGKFLHVLALSCGAKRILEVGTLAGYSSIWMGRALPIDGGRLVTIEVNPKHAELSRRNIERAGLSGRVEVACGDARATLDAMLERGEPAFDMTFIDADKESSADYFDRAVRLSRTGSVIVVDNVVRGGKVASAETGDAMVEGVRRLMEMIRQDTRVVASALQTVGSKGYDGLLMAFVQSRTG